MNHFRALKIIAVLMMFAASVFSQEINSQKTSELSDDIKAALEKIKKENGYYAQKMIDKSMQKTVSDGDAAAPSQSFMIKDDENEQEKEESTKKDVSKKEDASAIEPSQEPAAVASEGSKTEDEPEKEKIKAVDIKAEAFLKNFPDGNIKGIHKGDEVECIVRISWQGDLYAIIAEPPETFSLEGLSIKNIIPTFKSSPETGRASSEFHYILTAKDSGNAAIGPITIPFRFSDSNKKNVLKTSLITFNILPERKNWTKIIGIPLGIIILIIVSFVGGNYIRKIRLQAKERERAIANQPTPKECLLSELEAQKVVLIEGDIKTFYDNCFKLIRGFISLTCGDSTMKMTGAELSEFLEQSDINANMRDKALNLLNKCEGVRFGGYFPTPAENDDIIKDIRVLISSEISNKDNKTA